MSTTPHLGLPLLAAAQAQKHVTHNEALFALDALVQCAVLDRDLAAPPGSPAEGARAIVAASPTGAWAGRAGQIARWQEGAWSYVAPRAGFLAYVADEGMLCVFASGAWLPVTHALSVLQNLTRFGLGTTADAQNPFAAKLNKALWTALGTGEGGTGDLRYTLNKQAAGNVLSFLLQTGFSGRAEIGTIGSDRLAAKVSPDGATWREALSIDPATGGVDFLSAETSLAAAASLDLGAAASRRVRLTGGARVTSFGTGRNKERIVTADAAVTIAHNATSLVLPGAADLKMASGDSAVFGSDESGRWRLLAEARARSGWPEPKTIVVFGSSNGAGLGAATYTADPSAANGWASPATSWAGRLRTALLAIDPDWTLVNRSVSGTGTADGVSRFWRDVAPHRPSHVILCHHPSNDGFDFQAVLSNTLKLCRMCEQIGAVPVLRGAYMVDGMSAAQYQASLGLNRALDQFGFHRIDHFSTLDAGTGGFVSGSTFTVDGLHPNDAGYAHFFDAIDLGIFVRGTAHRGRAVARPAAWRVTPGATGSGILITPTTGFLGPGLRSFTLRARIKGAAAGGESARAFFGAYAQGPIASAAPLRLRNSAGPYDVTDAAGVFSLAGIALNPTADPAIRDFVMTYNAATNSLALYADGVAVGTPAGTLSGMREAREFVFGGRGDPAATAGGYTFADLGLWAVALRPEAVADMHRTGEKPPASMLVDAVLSGSPNPGGLVPNAVGTGIMPAIGSAVWLAADPY